MPGNPAPSDHGHRDRRADEQTSPAVRGSIEALRDVEQVVWQECPDDVLPRTLVVSIDPDLVAAMVAAASA